MFRKGPSHPIEVAGGIAGFRGCQRFGGGRGVRLRGREGCLWEEVGACAATVGVRFGGLSAVVPGAVHECCGGGVGGGWAVDGCAPSLAGGMSVGARRESARGSREAASRGGLACLVCLVSGYGGATVASFRGARVVSAWHRCLRGPGICVDRAQRWPAGDGSCSAPGVRGSDSAAVGSWFSGGARGGNRGRPGSSRSHLRRGTCDSGRWSAAGRCCRRPRCPRCPASHRIPL